MPGLRVGDGHGAQPEPGVFKQAAAHGDIRLALGQAARLQVDLRVEAQFRRCRRIAAGRLQVGNAL